MGKFYAKRWEDEYKKFFYGGTNKITPPSPVIERILTGKDGRITGLDIHDERFGEGVFLVAKTRHFHGYYDK